MDAFGLMGFVLGSTGMTFGIIAWGQITELSKEIKDLKTRLEDSGALDVELDSGT